MSTASSTIALKNRAAAKYCSSWALLLGSGGVFVGYASRYLFNNHSSSKNIATVFQIHRDAEQAEAMMISVTCPDAPMGLSAMAFYIMRSRDSRRQYLVRTCMSERTPSCVITMVGAIDTSQRFLSCTPQPPVTRPKPSKLLTTGT